MRKQAHLDYFNVELLSWKFYLPNTDLIEDIKLNGILVPIVCIAVNNQFFIIDGYQRFFAAKSLEINEIPYIITSPDLTTSDLIRTIQKQALFSSTILKLRYLNHFNLTLNTVSLSYLDLPYYSHIKKDFDRIINLPDSAQLFLHTKSFSFKEMVNLLHYAMDAFHRLLQDDNYFNFTKRTFDESLSMITSLLKRYSISFDELLLKLNYSDLIEQDLTVQQRQKKWMDL